MFSNQMLNKMIEMNQHIETHLSLFIRHVDRVIKYCVLSV